MSQNLNMKNPKNLNEDNELLVAFQQLHNKLSEPNINKSRVFKDMYYLLHPRFKDSKK
jgi:hypothetical protein